MSALAPPGGEDLLSLTPLRPVADWGWGLYRASYWRDEEHALAGADPLLEREFVESEGGVDRWLCYGDYAEDVPEGGWPQPRYGGGVRAGWVTWALVRPCAPGELRFVPGRVGGTQVVGAGWRTPLPWNWL